jgi:hypothetical protein
MATFSPGFTASETPSSTLTCGRDGYAKLTLSSVTSPRDGVGSARGAGGAAITGLTRSSSNSRSAAPDAAAT